MYKETYAAPLKAYENFWERKTEKRPTLNIAYTKPGAPRFRGPTTLEEKWLDENYHLAAYNHKIQYTGYIAEGVPMLFTNLGPGCLAACIGGNFTLAPNTIWFDRTPIVDDWENPPEIAMNEKSEMWKHLVRLQIAYAANPDVGFSMTDIGGIMDVVSSLRSAENLLYDLYDYPDEVREFTKKVTKLWFQMFDQQVEATRRAGLPYNSWMNIPSEKPWYPLQCDFCAMISPKQFEQFVLPEIVEQVEHMERSIYHLDGPGEIPHIDMLLDIPGLTGIQWTPGAGNSELWDEKWLDLYRKIQDKKKNLVLLGGLSERDMEGAERLIKSIDPNGVYISTWCSSKEKAEELLEKVTRWSE